MSEIEQALSHLIASVLKSYDGNPASASTHLNQAIVLLYELIPDWKACDADHAIVVGDALREMRMLGIKARNETCKNCYYYSTYQVSPHDFCELTQEGTHPDSTCDKWKQSLGFQLPYGG